MSIPVSRRPAHEIRADLLRKGYSLSAWARRHKVSKDTAHAAITGRRNGPKTLKVLAKIERFLSVA